MRKPDNALTPKFLQGLQIGIPVGDGRFGSVFTLVDKNGDTSPYALKTYRNDRYTACREGLLAAQAVQDKLSRRFQRVLRVVEHPVQPCAFLDFFPGEDLHVHAKKVARFDPNDYKPLTEITDDPYILRLAIAQALLRDIYPNLSALHKEGITTPDVSPTNIVINPYTSIYGITVSQIDPDSAQRTCIPCRPQVSKGWAAPELIDRSKNDIALTGRECLFSIGAIADVILFNDIDIRARNYALMHRTARKRYSGEKADMAHAILELTERLSSEEPRKRPVLDELNDPRILQAGFAA